MADTKPEMNNGTSPSRVVLAKPRLGGFGSSGFGASTSVKTNPIGSILRPPQLKPNPFLKPETSSNPCEIEKKETKNDEDKHLTGDNAPKFVRLGVTNVTSKNSNPVPAPPPAASTASSSGFIFGQNLSARVVVGDNVNNGDSDPSDHNSTNGTTELLFSNAVAAVKENNPLEESTVNTDAVSGLAAAAAEYERGRERAPPPAIPSCTGEEGETNVAQISCRLFAWESGSWRERGRGLLRLNDFTGGARLVARVSGSLRVVLNTKLWPDMVAELAGVKSLRITAADTQQQVKLFLIMGAPSDIVQLHRLISSRIAVCKRNAPQSSTNDASERLEDSTTSIEKPSKESSESNKETSQKTADEKRVDDETVPEEEAADTSMEDKNLKRKELMEDDTSPKRQCPKIVIE